jgi:hypothetical protein
VLFVGIHCPLAVAVQREQCRNDRAAGWPRRSTNSFTPTAVSLPRQLSGSSMRSRGTTIRPRRNDQLHRISGRPRCQR